MIKIGRNPTQKRGLKISSTKAEKKSFRPGRKSFYGETYYKKRFGNGTTKAIKINKEDDQKFTVRFAGSAVTVLISRNIEGDEVFYMENGMGKKIFPILNESANLAYEHKGRKNFGFITKINSGNGQSAVLEVFTDPKHSSGVVQVKIEKALDGNEKRTVEKKELPKSLYNTPKAKLEQKVYMLHKLMEDNNVDFRKNYTKDQIKLFEEFKGMTFEEKYQELQKIEKEYLDMV